MTRKEAILFAVKADVAVKEWWVNKLGEEIFNEFVSMGFLDTCLGKAYWVTTLLKRYATELSENYNNYGEER